MHPRLRPLCPLDALHHRRRIKTEEKAKVVAAVWGHELIQFLAAIDIFHHYEFEEKDVLQKTFVQIILTAKWLVWHSNKNSDDLCLLFCLYPSSIIQVILYHTVKSLQIRKH